MTNIRPLAKEPAVTTGASVGVVILALIGLLRAFGVDLSEDQSAAIVSVVAVLAPIVTGWLIRPQVWSPAGLADVVPVHTGAGVADIAPDGFDDPTDKPLDDEADEPDEIPDPAGDHRAGKPIGD